MRLWVRRYPIQTPRLTVQRRSLIALAEGEEPQGARSKADGSGGGVPRAVSVRLDLIGCAFSRYRQPTKKSLSGRSQTRYSFLSGGYVVPWVLKEEMLVASSVQGFPSRPATSYGRHAHRSLPKFDTPAPEYESSKPDPLNHLLWLEISGMDELWLIKG